MPWSSLSLVMWQLRNVRKMSMCVVEWQREGKRAKAAAVAGLPGGNTEREHKLIRQVVADRDAGFNVLAHFVKRFLRDMLGWHPATADTGEDFGDVLRMDFKDEGIAGSDSCR